jgi:hypothetical protein
MNTIVVVDAAGSFAQNKDVARQLRVERIVPLSETGDEFAIDFKGVDLSTQSFIHALISEPLGSQGPTLLERMRFLNCSEVVRQLILTVVDYTLNREFARDEKAV